MGLADVFNVNVSSMGQSAAITKQTLASYDPNLGDVMARYWASFVQSGLPQSAVAWPSYKGSIPEAQLLSITTERTDRPHLATGHDPAAPKCEFFQDFIRKSKEQ